MSPFSLALVPAWNTFASVISVYKHEITSPLLEVSVYTFDAKTLPSVLRSSHTASAGKLPAMPASTKSTKDDFKRIMIGWVSGSPKRQLNSITFGRSEEHTSELQSRENIVCRLLLEKKKGHQLECEIDK